MKTQSLLWLGYSAEPTGVALLLATHQLIYPGRIVVRPLHAAHFSLICLGRKSYIILDLLLLIKTTSGLESKQFQYLNTCTL